MAPAMFPVGAEVEVSCEDEGFQGAWYEARVIRAASGRRPYVIVYDSLVDDEDSRPLFETVAAANIRPRPPQPSEPQIFTLHQLIDAFYNDGWWAGVVSAVPQEGGGKYSVCFPNTREEMEFSSAELRPRRYWIRGKWVSPDGKDKSTRQSSSGTESVNHEQYSYASSITDKSKGPLSVMALSFEGNETLGRSGIYAMNFGNPKIARSTFRSQLKSSQPRKKWKKDEEAIEDNAKLLDFIVMARGTKTPSRMGTGFDVTTPAAKERSNFHLRSFIIDRFGYSKNLLRDKNTVGSDHMTPPCSGTLLEGTNHETLVPARYGLESLRLHTPLSTTGLANNGEEYGKQGKDGSKNQSGTLHLCCSSSSKGADYTWCPLTNDHQKKKLVSKHQQDNLPDDNGVRQLAVGENRRKRVRPQKIKLSDRNVSLQGQNVQQSDGSSHVTIVSEHVKEGVSAIVDSSCISCEVQPPCHGSKERGNEDSPSALDSQGQNVKQSDGSSHVTIVSEHAKGGVSAIVDSSCISCEVQPPCHGSKKRGNEDSPSALDSQGTLVRENVSRTTDVQQVNKVASEQSVEGHSMSQLEAVTQNNCLSGLETLNLAMCSENAWLVKTSNSCIQQSEAGSEEQNGVLAPPLGGQIDKRAPTGKAEAVTESCCKSPTKKLYLPFEKCSSLWETLESMEILSAMPQQPHFRPLGQYCKEFREGMAIGLLVTFCDLLGRIRKLHITDSRSRFDEGLKTLVHFEEHGFNVQGVCARLNELLRIKDNQEQLLEKKSALVVSISEKQVEQDCLNSKIQEIDEAIMNLEQSLMQFHHKKASVLKLKEDNDSELVKLQMDARSVEEVLTSAKQGFEAILSAPW